MENKQIQMAFLYILLASLPTLITTFLYCDISEISDERFRNFILLSLCFDLPILFYFTSILVDFIGIVEVGALSFSMILVMFSWAIRFTIYFHSNGRYKFKKNTSERILKLNPIFEGDQ